MGSPSSYAIRLLTFLPIQPETHHHRQIEWLLVVGRDCSNIRSSNLFPISAAILLKRLSNHSLWSVYLRICHIYHNLNAYGQNEKPYLVLYFLEAYTAKPDHYLYLAPHRLSSHRNDSKPHDSAPAKTHELAVHSKLLRNKISCREPHLVHQDIPVFYWSKW